jgi:hypothetical protein
MAAIYSNGGNRWNILGFNFTKGDALSSVYKISMVPLNIILLACIFCYFVAYPKASFIESTCTINRLFGLGSAQKSSSTYLFHVVVHLSSPRYIYILINDRFLSRQPEPYLSVRGFVINGTMPY